MGARQCTRHARPLASSPQRSHHAPIRYPERNRTRVYRANLTDNASGIALRGGEYLCSPLAGCDAVLMNAADLTQMGILATRDLVLPES